MMRLCVHVLCTSPPSQSAQLLPENLYFISQSNMELIMNWKLETTILGEPVKRASSIVDELLAFTGCMCAKSHHRDLGNFAGGC